MLAVKQKIEKKRKVRKKQRESMTFDRKFEAQIC